MPVIFDQDGNIIFHEPNQREAERLQEENNLAALSKGAKPHPKALKQRVSELQRMQGIITRELALIRESFCDHVDHSKTAHSNSGGYESDSYDKYWYNCVCNTCGHRWTEDQKEYNERWKGIAQG